MQYVTTDAAPEAGRATGPVAGDARHGSTPHPTDPDARTRDRVARTVLERGPVSASELAPELGITPAAVRRHLERMLADGLVEAREAPAHAPRGRGRPARQFVLSDAGHAAMNTSYDDLATSALRFLADQGGRAAVEAFAQARVADLEQRYAPVVDAAGQDVRSRTEALAEALSADGYAASTRPLAGGAAAAQLCQGHCPVQQVAAEFPELCEAETEAFSRLLGVHVQRLATLAHGEHVCTTHVPAAVPPAPPRHDSHQGRTH